MQEKVRYLMRNRKALTFFYVMTINFYSNYPIRFAYLTRYGTRHSGLKNSYSKLFCYCTYSNWKLNLILSNHIFLLRSK